MDYFDENSGTKISSSNIFHSYSTKENQLTKALMHLFEESGLDLLHYIAMNLQIDLKKTFYTVKTQQSLKEKKQEKDDFSTIDGLIMVSPLQFLIENKIVKDSVNPNQLDRHRDYVETLRNLSIPTVLLYVTPDEDKPAILEKYEVNWCKWSEMRALIDNYYINNNIFSNLRLAFDGLYDFIFKGKVSIPKDKLVAVLAGRFALPIALQEGIYYCQPWRSFRGAKYLAFYCEKEISKVFKILEVYGSKEDITDPILKEKTKNLTNDKIFVLEELKDFLKEPIKNNKKDKYGKTVAFTMGQPRYFELMKLKKAKVTTDLENIKN